MDLAQAFFLLQSLRQNVPNSSQVGQKWVDDFHSILDTVEKETGANLTAFRVQQTDLYHPVISTRRASRYGRAGHIDRSKAIVVERARLMHKMDAVLSYFQYTQNAGEAKQHIGFKAGP
jgi:hypothetical protein